MAVDNDDILKAVLDLTTKIESYHGDMRERSAKTETEVATLKADAETAKTWNRIGHMVAPVLILLHALARKFGVNI
jgi:hypothetical protein